MSSQPHHDPHTGLPPHGQFAYPYADQAPMPGQLAPQTVVTAGQLAPVRMPEPAAEQLYYAPVAPARDQSRTTLAAVITFLALIVALWGILGFLSSMSGTLNDINAGTTKLKGQMTTANAGLRGLDEKTGHLDSLATDSVALKGKLGAIDGGMASMLKSIDVIAANMQAMEGSLVTLDSELGKLNTANANVSEQLGGIRTGLVGQQKSVAGMAKDVKGTGTVLGQLPPRLIASNDRLKHINGVVNFMGCTGIAQKLQATFYLGPIRNGSGTINATIAPAGAWGTNADGSPCR